MKANEVIMIGPQAELRGLHGRLEAALAVLALLLGELDDEHRILAGQARQDHETDLREDVVIHAAEHARRPGRRAGSWAR